jgi:hypothetical protein
VNVGQTGRRQRTKLSGVWNLSKNVKLKKLKLFSTIVLELGLKCWVQKCPRLPRGGGGAGECTVR